MKSQNRWYSALMIASLFFSGIANPSAQDVEFAVIFTPNPYLGVRIDSILLLYEFQDGWVPYSGWDVFLPGELDELLIASNGQVGVRKGNALTFYEVSSLFGAMLGTDSLDLLLPDNVDELILSVEGDLGMRMDDSLKFYLFDHEWQHEKQHDFVLPSIPDELLITSNGLLGIRTGRELKFYEVVNNYAHAAQFDLTLPFDVDELALTFGDELCARKGKELRFFRYTDKWESLPELDFEIEIPDGEK